MEPTQPTQLDHSAAVIATDPVTGEPRLRIPIAGGLNLTKRGLAYGDPGVDPNFNDVLAGDPQKALLSLLGLVPASPNTSGIMPDRTPLPPQPPVPATADLQDQRTMPTVLPAPLRRRFALTKPESAPAEPGLNPQQFAPSFSSVAGPAPNGLPQPINGAETKLGKLLHLGIAVGLGAANGIGQMNPAAGAQAAREVPFQEAEQRQQLAQQRAQTGLLQAEQENVDIPGFDHPIPMWLAKSMGPAWLRAQGMENVQNQKGKTAVTVQGMKGQNALSVQGFKLAIQNGQVAHVEDGIDPTTNQPAKMAYDRMGHLVGVLPGSLPSSSYLPKATDTVEYKENENGDIIALPKRTTTQPAIPGTPKPPASGTSTPRVVAHGPKAGKENDAADAEQFASAILNEVGGDPDKALKYFDQKSPSITDSDQKRLGPAIRKAIRARRQINKPQNPLDKIISGDVEGGLNDLQSAPQQP